MEIYERYYKMVFGAANRILNNKMEAEDVMQESFLEAFQRLRELKEKEKFGAWIKRIAINKSLNEIRKKGRYDLELKSDYIEEKDEDNGSFVEMEAKKIYDCMKELPEGYRIITSLYLIEGYDHEEIGEILSIKSSTSRSQFTRAKVKLKEIYKSNYEKSTG